MKKAALIMTLLLFLLSGNLYPQKGHYKNGKGSSHKGGHYKNPNTGDHYRKRK